MKINCDVCSKDEASVFCPADDAALCAACDHGVHHANNLAGKHPRYSLLRPSPNNSPLCDICQEEKALLFCQQDRAILCKNCDVAIHKVNEHTKNHCRFLLTGVKLSPVALIPTTGNSVVPPKSLDREALSINKPIAAVSAPIANQTQKINGSDHGSMTASTISDYLIETLPGWHVEDFLDSPNFFKTDDDVDLAVFWDNEDLKGSLNDCLSPKTMGIWVPQAPPPAAPPPPPILPQPPLQNPYQFQSFTNMGFGSQMINEASPLFAPFDVNKITKSNGKKELEDGNCFAVPQIGPLMSTNFKRSRIYR